MRLVHLILPLALVACASTPGASDQAAPFTGQPQATVTAPVANVSPSVDLPAGTYRLDPRHATVLFRIRHMDLAWFTARFDTKTVELVLNPSDVTQSRLTASVDATTVNTGLVNQQGERSSFDRSIGRALGSDTNQQITFTSTAITRTSENTGRVTGDLTMNGQTHPATLNVTFDGGATDPLRGGAMVLGFSAHGTINRADWGVTEWQAFTGDDVQIVIEAELVRA